MQNIKFHGLCPKTQVPWFPVNVTSLLHFLKNVVSEKLAKQSGLYHKRTLMPLQLPLGLNWRLMFEVMLDKVRDKDNGNEVSFSTQTYNSLCDILNSNVLLLPVIKRKINQVGGKLKHLRD